MGLMCLCIPSFRFHTGIHFACFKGMPRLSQPVWLIKDQDGVTAMQTCEQLPIPVLANPNVEQPH